MTAIPERDDARVLGVLGSHGQPRLGSERLEAVDEGHRKYFCAPTSISGVHHDDSLQSPASPSGRSVHGSEVPAPLDGNDRHSEAASITGADVTLPERSGHKCDAMAPCFF